MSKWIDAEKPFAFISRLMGCIPKVLLDEYEEKGIDIVRCKECKWAKANGTYQWCGRLDSTAQITADDFCSYGQKGDENVETD